MQVCLVSPTDQNFINHQTITENCLSTFKHKDPSTHLFNNDEISYFDVGAVNADNSASCQLFVLLRVYLAVADETSEVVDRLADHRDT